MKIIEIKSEDKKEICDLLNKSNKLLEEAMFKLKEVESESDTRSWRIEDDYMNDYRYDEHRNNRKYRDDFRYR